MYHPLRIHCWFVASCFIDVTFSLSRHRFSNVVPYFAAVCCLLVPMFFALFSILWFTIRFRVSLLLCCFPASLLVLSLFTLSLFFVAIRRTCLRPPCFSIVCSRRCFNIACSLRCSLHGFGLENLFANSSQTTLTRFLEPLHLACIPSP